MFNERENALEHPTAPEHVEAASRCPRHKNWRARILFLDETRGATKRTDCAMNRDGRAKKAARARHSRAEGRGDSDCIQRSVSLSVGNEVSGPLGQPLSVSILLSNTRNRLSHHFYIIDGQPQSKSTTKHPPKNSKIEIKKFKIDFF